MNEEVRFALAELEMIQLELEQLRLVLESIRIERAKLLYRACGTKGH